MIQRAATVDDGGRAGRREATGEDPVAIGQELLIEHIDSGRHLRGCGVGRVGQHGNQVPRTSESSPVVVWPPPRTASHSYYERRRLDPTHSAEIVTRINVRSAVQRAIGSAGGGGFVLIRGLDGGGLA